MGVRGASVERHGSGSSALSGFLSITGRLQPSALCRWLISLGLIGFVMKRIGRWNDRCWIGARSEQRG